MILEIVEYGHPALRAKGRNIEKIDRDLLQLISDMLETMYEADGVGLAAQQVGRPLQLCVIDVDGIKDRPSTMWVDGKKVALEEYMPMVLINPELELIGKPKAGVEGCLSFPGIRADIDRPPRVKVKAIDAEGQALNFEADGLLARAVQHEYDHLQGVLFIDRMSDKDRKALNF
ncbi:peptide deformylase [Terrimicrobium sacchariphilum]|jgi:peptide deformylase|uniref:Peptide deformylase n=1 Tax=Terrimicrobium sacchariphilum TaxID=690879 RepID=A0A146G5V5_TERSA|nr:peptide deformylase [Terrimicrobium sacchariphilum]GAT33135.1 peptide deformylase [Terrimicrobium sacchariphilum]